MAGGNAGLENERIRLTGAFPAIRVQVPTSNVSQGVWGLAKGFLIMASARYLWVGEAAFGKSFQAA